VRSGNEYFVNLNRISSWLEWRRRSSSGVAILDRNLKEIRRFKLGWETHAFCILAGRHHVLCGSSGAIKPIVHPHRAGLMVDGELVFEHDPNEFFCKDFCFHKGNYFLVGGSVKKRGDRKDADGVLFILNADYRLVEQKVFSGSGGFCGCLAL
jgi:hypothetical protein